MKEVVNVQIENVYYCLYASLLNLNKVSQFTHLVWTSNGAFYLGDL